MVVLIIVPLAAIDYIVYQTLSQSQISKCLKRIAELMGYSDSAPLHSQEHKRRRPVACPRLHEALFVWMKAIEKVVTITGAIPQAKVAKSFPRIYPNETVPLSDS